MNFMIINYKKNVLILFFEKTTEIHCLISNMMQSHLFLTTLHHIYNQISNISNNTRYQYTKRILSHHTTFPGQPTNGSWQPDEICRIR